MTAKRHSTVKLSDSGFAAQPITFLLNGVQVNFEAVPTQRLSDVLRDQFACTDIKIGCNAGDCGACTVLVGNAAVCSCLTAVGQVSGKTVDSLTGLTEVEPLMAQLQHSFLVHGAAQCGICTPGMLVSAVSLLRENPNPDEATVKDALGGVLCRCTGYRKIIDAVVAATSLTSDAASPGPTEQLDNPSVGLSVVRLDGRKKVLGTDTFGDDVAPADSLVVKLVRSPFHHARFVLGDLSAYQKHHPGIVRIFDASDIPGSNGFGVIPPFIDQPVFAEGVTRFKGECVAAVVGDAATMDAMDLRDFPVQWTELQAVLDPLAAQQPEAVQLHEQSANNVLCHGRVQCGDAKAGLAKAHVRASGTFSTGFIEHAYIEPEAGYATRTGSVLTVYGCTQAPYMNRASLAEVLDLNPEAIRVVPTAVGGGFGSKLDLSYQPYVALAAWVLDRPVRIAYTRQESMQSTTKRHPSLMQVDIGADEQGLICGFTFEGTFNTGAYASWGPTVANRVPVHASGPYYTPNYSANTTGIYTHSAPAGAFRGFGVPQAAIAQESLFDELAEKLGMDRLAFRTLNALENRQRTVTGQTFAGSVGIRQCLMALQEPWLRAQEDAEAFNEQALASGSAWRRGVGVASGWYGCGNTSLPNPSTIKAGLRSDGIWCLHQGAVDIGQGSNTVIAQIFADTLGVPLQGIELISADSSITPDAGKTSASRQTFVSGNAARLTGLALRESVARMTNCTKLLTLRIEDSQLVVNESRPDETTIDLSRLPILAEDYVLMAEESYDPPTKPLDENGQGEPYAQYGYAAQMVTLDVDTKLGVVSLQHICAAHDVGKAINPLMVEGQIHGGVAQGVGLALMEEFIPGRTENLHDYLIPTIGDIPPIDTIIVEIADDEGPFGAKGLGEHVLIPTAPAVLNAITNACGARVVDMPATPEKILAAIHAKREVH